MAKMTLRFKGGSGSGNFGHAGRPGEVGGSASGKGSGAPTKGKKGAVNVPEGWKPTRKGEYTKTVDGFSMHVNRETDGGETWLYVVYSEDEQQAIKNKRDPYRAIFTDEVFGPNDYDKAFAHAEENFQWAKDKITAKPKRRRYPKPSLPIYD